MKILIADPIASSAVELLQKKYEVVEQHYSPNELLNAIPQFDALIVRSATKVTKNIIENASNLKIIGRAGVGVDNIDIAAATERNIPVVYSPGASSISVAEMAMMFMLALARKVVDATNKTREGKWPKVQLMGVELYGKLLGFVGCGRIGAEVVKRAQAFGMKCLIYDPYLPKKVIEQLGAESTDNLSYLFQKSDFITIHALLTNETRNMISKNEFDVIKPTAYIINCARGGIIDEKALYIALKEKKIKGAALDVFNEEPAKENELFELDNVYVTPHISASTEEAQDRAGIVVAEQVILGLTGQKLEFCVNAKEIKN